MPVAASPRTIDPASFIDAASPAALACTPYPESERLKALANLDILDTPREEAFDRLTRLARKMFDVPIALVSFIEGHRQWYKAAEGMDAKEVPRRDSFCRYVIEADTALVVPHASKDPVFADNRFVVGVPHVRFYAGVPLRTREGMIVGTLCLLDTKPREFPEREVELLTDLAHIAVDELELRQFVRTDSLTGALSRRAFKEELARTAALALRHHDDLSVIALDLDHFKAVNDTHGHAVGDQMLRAIVDAARGQLRDTDLIGRLGGEEFAALLPNTGSAGALEVAERMRKAIAEAAVPVGETMLRVTTSLGIASLDAMTRDADEILSHADAALYQAKESGRNRSVVWRDQNAAPRAAGRRVLKSGQLVFNAGRARYDCTVRRLSDEGATVDVSSTVGIPPRFDLIIKADDFQKACRVVSQREQQIDVVFT